MIEFYTIFIYKNCFFANICTFYTNIVYIITGMKMIRTLKIVYIVKSAVYILGNSQ